MTDRTAAIVGAYEHPARLAPDKSDLQLIAEAARAVLDDAGLKKSDIDGVCVSPNLYHGGNVSSINLLIDYLNLHPGWVDSTYAGGASFQYQAARAVRAVEAGDATCVLLLFGSTPRSNRIALGSTGVLRPKLRDRLKPNAESFEDIYGLTIMGFFAMTARRHMALYGTTEEHLAQVSVTERQHASLNPEAKYRDPISIEDVLNSRYISDPLRLLNCCMISDGAAAVIVASPEVARGCKKKPVWILGSGEDFSHTDGGYGDWLDLGTRRAGPQAFAKAGISHRDVDTLQVYDATSYHVIMSLEDLGFCGTGEGGAFIDGGQRISLNGELPTNTDGGGLSSNQVGTRGPFLLVEAVRQLRDECDERQVKNCKIAVTSSLGGGGEGGELNRRSASVFVLGRD